MSSTPRRNYRRVQNLLLAAGLVVIALIATTMVMRGVDRVEVIATLLFAPTYLALLYFGTSGGLLAGVTAGAAYVLLRYPALDLVGPGPLIGLIAGRVVGYVVFGGVGGWAASRVIASLEKLELVDDVDDATGLGNARSLLDRVSLERSRASRYGSDFTVATAEFSRLPSRKERDRQSRGQLRNLGLTVAASVRESDHAVHVGTGDSHLIAIVLPQTGVLGANVVVRTLTEHIRQQFNTPVSSQVYAANDPNLDQLLSRFLPASEPAVNGT